jgi:CxxC-x17-CxxC domain-containing protein
MKNETNILGLINKIQEQLIALDKKVDTLINRSVPAVKPPTPPADHNKGRVMHTAICADCKKECTIPFKPSGDRPIYCQDCFSRRKVIRLSGITVPSPQTTINKAIDIQKPPAKAKKKASVKKPVGKKKPVPKKK